MKILQINSTYKQGSTGKIAFGISQELEKNKFECFFACPFSKSNDKNVFCYSSWFETKVNVFFSHAFGRYGFVSRHSTKKLIKIISKTNPDIILIHNIHSHDINIKHFFSFLSNKDIRIFWTFHDCWAFTGYCPFFSFVDCHKWKENGCEKCVQKKDYSWLFDKAKQNYQEKKRALQSVNFTIICPSIWMKSAVSNSFLKEKNSLVIHNGIDLELFDICSSNHLLQKHNVSDKKIVLGVAYEFNERKGIDYLIYISKKLPENYRLLLIGRMNPRIKLPLNVIHIDRTESQKELAEYYSLADVFVNPTRDDNFPSTHLEALACGTPVVTFDVGGAGEALTKETGFIIQPGRIDDFVDKIIFICENNFKEPQVCRERAKVFSNEKSYKKYVELIKNG